MTSAPGISPAARLCPCRTGGPRHDADSSRAFGPGALQRLHGPGCLSGWPTRHQASRNSVLSSRATHPGALTRRRRPPRQPIRPFLLRVGSTTSTTYLGGGSDGQPLACHPPAPTSRALLGGGRGAPLPKGRSDIQAVKCNKQHQQPAPSTSAASKFSTSPSVLNWAA